MNVAELIEHLQTLDPGLPVLVEGYETGFDKIEAIHLVSVFRFHEAPGWDGEYQTPAEFIYPDVCEAGATENAIAILGRREVLRVDKTRMTDPENDGRCAGVRRPG